jgi:transglutaminase-like putative cysteine protease
LIRINFSIKPHAMPPSADWSDALRATPTLDSDHPAVIDWVRHVVGDTTGAQEQAVRLYYAVRDGFRYDPYRIDLSTRGMSASHVIECGYGWCIPKAVLLAAACRVVGIAARVGLADVRNHLSTARLREKMGTDVFYRHGYTAIHLNGQWLKATPAFNIELCRKLRLQPREFDGTTDSIYHPFDLDGQRHMEYLALLGEHDDLPLDDLRTVFATHYPQLLASSSEEWLRDVERESAAQSFNR